MYLTTLELVAESAFADCLNLGILLCLFTGIRIGELCALTWDKISLSERNLCICQTMQRIQTRIPESQKTHILISSPKSSSANRTIPVSHMLFEYLNMYPLGKTGYFLSGSSSRLIEPRCVPSHFFCFIQSLPFPFQPMPLSLDSDRFFQSCSAGADVYKRQD